MDKRFLTTKQVADALGLTAQTVRLMIERRQLAGVRIGQRGWRIPASELVRLSERAERGDDVGEVKAEVKS